MLVVILINIDGSTCAKRGIGNTQRDCLFVDASKRIIDSHIQYAYTYTRTHTHTHTCTHIQTHTTLIHTHTTLTPAHILACVRTYIHTCIHAYSRTPHTHIEKTITQTARQIDGQRDRLTHRAEHGLP